MRITYKLTVLHILALALVLGLHGWVSVRREVQLVEAEKRQRIAAYGKCLAELVRQVWSDHGDERALELLGRVDSSSEDVRVRWLWLDEGGGPSRGLLAELRQGRAAMRVEHGEAGGRLTTYVPVVTRGERIGAVRLQESLDDESEYVLDSVRRVASTTALAAVVFGVLAAIVGSRLVGRPMHEIVSMARRIGQGDLTRRLALSQRDELGELAGEMNLMCERLSETREQLQRETAARIEAIERLRHNDRLATVGRLAAGMAHELGTPLSVAQGHADLILAGDLTKEEVDESARVISRLAQRMAGTIRQLLDFARRRPAEKDVHDLGRLSRRSLDMLQEMARRAGVTIRTDDAKVMAEVDGAQLEQVVTNLAVNAIHAMPDGGVVQVRVRTDRVVPPADHPRAGRGALDVACISVTDQGVGIAPEHLEILYEPFFTTKPVGQGTGLGLPIVQGIVQEHGGWIDVTTEVGRGSTFTVYLPRGGAEG